MIPKELYKIENLKKSYGNRISISNFNLLINEKDFILIIGTSGCGKTTLLNILSLQDFKFEGSCLFMQTNVKKLRYKTRSLIRNQYFGFIYQDHNLVSNRTVKENILMPYLYSEQVIDDDWYNKVLNILGIQDIEFEIVNHLSGGQQQRVAIARAVILKPKVIFADEPLASLDVVNKKIVIEQFKQLIEEVRASIIMVSHDELDDLKESVTKIIDMGQNK